MTVISTPNASLKQPVHIDPISNIKSMPGEMQSLSESSRVRSIADLRLPLRHCDPTHSYLRAISAWRRGLLAGLWHGHPAHRYSSGIPTCRTIQQSLSNRPLNGPRPLFGTATPPTSTSEPSPRDKGGLLTGLRHVHPAHRCHRGILAEPL